MATVRSGDKAALLVLDVQVGVMRGTWDEARIASNIVRAVERAREAGLPVIWVQHTDADLPHASREWQWIPNLVPAEGEVRIEKAHNSAFEDTSLDAELAKLGVSHIVLAGAATSWCVRATAYAALERGYDLTLLSDAHTTEHMEAEDDTLIAAPCVVQDLNIVLRWLTYPGRRSRVRTVDEMGGDLRSSA